MQYVQVSFQTRSLIGCYNPQSDWLSNQHRFKTFFSEGIENGLFNGDDILNEYKRKVRRLYNHVTETSTMNIEIETLVMLTAGKFQIRALRTVQTILV